MSFLSFIQSLPFPSAFSVLFFAMLLFFVGLGLYKFVKDWLPW